MPALLTDDLGRPIPQYLNTAGTAFEALKGVGGASKTASDDGAHVALGSTTDTEAMGDGSVIGILKRVRTLLGTEGIKVSAISVGDNLIGRVKLTDGTDVAAIDADGSIVVRVSSSALPTGAATETTLQTVSSYTDTIKIILQAMKDTDGIKKIVDALPVGDNLIGRVKLTDGTDVAAIDADGSVVVRVGSALPAGSNNIGDVDVLSFPATNREGTALTSAARTTTTSSADLDNPHKNGVHVILDVTEISGSPSITLKVEGKDPASGKYYSILEGAAVTTAGTYVYKVFPGATSAANSVANDIVPKTWRVTVEHANTDSITYSVGYSLT